MRLDVVAISGGASASFQYDPFGRRVSKTVGGTTQYLYDGVNPVQEISGSSASANLLTGAVDEYFQRTDSAGARSFLTDALGSTLALADSTGSLQTQYTFEPFGKTSVAGAATTNSSVFTGRELDSTGLYFFRARYYSPNLQRFISEDPLDFGGGDVNLYAYTGNSPTNRTDPSGKSAACPATARRLRLGPPSITLAIFGRKSFSVRPCAGDTERLCIGTANGGQGTYYGPNPSASGADPAFGPPVFVAAAVAGPFMAGLDALAPEATSGVASDTIPVIGRLPETSAYANRAGYEIMNPVGWDTAKNGAWVQSLIDARKTILLASPITEANILSATNASGFTVFADEISQILGAGYQWIGDCLVPPAQF